MSTFDCDICLRSQLLPGVHVAIANPDTLGQCADSQLGEIWVSSPHNSTELLGPFESASLTRASHTQPPPNGNPDGALRARLVTGDTERVYARTGFLGFVRRTELTQSDGGKLIAVKEALLISCSQELSRPV
ncbi:hypothetical protein AHF37_04810 [Paragonimus kellicotti]|nr:hypothetical protein AHF37_04810 [Paragonimus kellicotti]